MEGLTLAPHTVTQVNVIVSAANAKGTVMVEAGPDLAGQPWITTGRNRRVASCRHGRGCIGGRRNQHGRDRKWHRQGRRNGTIRSSASHRRGALAVEGGLAGTCSRLVCVWKRGPGTDKPCTTPD